MYYISDLFIIIASFMFVCVDIDEAELTNKYI
jgi:hypothetical protein